MLAEPRRQAWASDAAQYSCEAHLDDQVKTQTANDGIPSSAGPENQPSRRPRPRARPRHATNATHHATRPLRHQRES